MLDAAGDAYNAERAALNGERYEGGRGHVQQHSDGIFAREQMNEARNEELDAAMEAGV